MRILRFAAAVLGAVAVAGTIGTPVASAQPGCADLRGVVGQDQICRVHVQTDMYTIDMSFPNDYPDQQSLVAYLTQSRDGFVNVAEDPDAYNLPYELDADGAGYRSSSLLPGGGTRSVVFTMYQNVGGAHPQTYYQAFNWNLGHERADHVRFTVQAGHYTARRDLPRGQSLPDERAGADRRDPADPRPGSGQLPELRTHR